MLFRSISHHPFDESFPWMDTKFGISKKWLEQGSQEGGRTINTSSDLIARDDYASLLHKNDVINIYALPENDHLNRLLFPGNPSQRRLQNAYDKLKEQGFNVNLIKPTQKEIVKSIEDKLKLTPTYLEIGRAHV